MSVNREAAYAALADRLQSQVRSLLADDVHRRLTAFADLAQAVQPAIDVIADSEQPSSNEAACTPRWTLNALVFVYARADSSPSSSAETPLAIIVAAVEGALARQAGETSLARNDPTHDAWTTLGGTVQYAEIDGVSYDSGQTEQQGMALIKVKMLALQA
jgi:hypothetical protein